MSKHGFPTTPTSEHSSRTQEGDASLVVMGRLRRVENKEEENSGTQSMSATCQWPTPADFAPGSLVKLLGASLL